MIKILEKIRFFIGSIIILTMFGVILYVIFALLASAIKSLSAFLALIAFFVTCLLILAFFCIMIVAVLWFTEPVIECVIDWISNKLDNIK